MNTNKITDYDAMDIEAPMPYKRKEGRKEGSEAQFVYEKKETVTKNVITTPAKRQQLDATGQVIGEVQDPDVITKEEYTSTKEKKVTLMTYGDTSDEDIESFFDAFDRMKSELKVEWEEASQEQWIEC
jgi:hypothetical protein